MFLFLNVRRRCWLVPVCAFIWAWAASGTEARAETYQLSAVWGGYGKAAGQFNKPTGVAVAPDGSVYVVDQANQRIQKFAANGEFLLTWGSHGVGNGLFTLPHGIAVGKDRSVYVSDWARSVIQKFTADGTFITLWGGLGSDTGNLRQPEGMEVGPDGRLYVADAGNKLVQVFESDGRNVRSFGMSGLQPHDIAVCLDGVLRVISFHNGYVHALTPEGKVLSCYPREGSTPARFSKVMGLACGPDGILIVADTYNHRVQVLEPGIERVAARALIGAKGSEKGAFSFPYAVAVGKDGGIYVADKENHRIQFFVPVHQ